MPAPPGLRDALLTAPDTLSLGGYVVKVDPGLYRDFMPSSPENGWPLSAFCRLRVEGVIPFPSLPISEASIWVFKGDEMWTKQARIERFYDCADISIADGPYWGPGISVDLVLAIRDDSGKPHLVAFRDVPIQRTE